MPAKSPPPKAPRIVDLEFGLPPPMVPNKSVSERLGSPSIVIGIDIETYDWQTKEKLKGRMGQFGFYTLRSEDNLKYASIVQIGWVIGDTQPESIPMISKEYIVKPDGFRISSKAEKYHGISHEKVMKDGVPLKTMLKELFDDISAPHLREARLVAHHLEFDAGIIRFELDRCNLLEINDQWWASMMRKGICTMDPYIGRWVRTCFGKDPGPETAMNVMSLQELLKWTMPQSDHLLAKHHAAGADAHMHRLLYIGLLKLMSKALHPAHRHTP